MNRYVIGIYQFNTNIIGKIPEVYIYATSLYREFLAKAMVFDVNCVYYLQIKCCERDML